MWTGSGQEETYFGLALICMKYSEDISSGGKEWGLGLTNCIWTKMAE